MSEKDQIIELFSQYVMPTYAPSIVLARGQGTKVWDADGKVYLDFAAGISVVNVGHCHPHVVAAVAQQAAKLTHVSNLFYTENQAILAQRLARTALGGKCFFGNSGAEANEGLIKLARLWGHDNGKYEVICMSDSFHGRTLATAAATGQEKVQKGFEPLPVGFVHAEYNDLDSVAKLVNDKTVAVLLEAVQGEGGVVPAEPAFMQGVRALCDEKDILMLCDEVQCGMARTGAWFGFQHYDVEPDAFSLAKALGSGYPIGAVVSSPKLADVFSPGSHASTFGGSPLACASALATLEVIEEEELVARAEQAGKLLSDGLEAFVGRYEHVQSVRGKGLMLGMVLNQPARPLLDLLLDMGLIALPAGEKVVRFLPPLNVKDAEIEEALDMLDDCLAEWHGVSIEESDSPDSSDESSEPDETPSAEEEVTGAEDVAQPAAEPEVAPAQPEEPAADEEVEEKKSDETG